MPAHLLVYKNSHYVMIFFISHWFSNFCIYIIEDFLNLSENALETLNFSIFLNFILWLFSFSGKLCLNFGCIADFFAKFKHSDLLLSLRLCKFNMFNAFVYDLYRLPKIILNAVFWTLSKSLVLSFVSELCQTVADCSSKLRMNRI